MLGIAFILIMLIYAGSILYRKRILGLLNQFVGLTPDTLKKMNIEHPAQAWRNFRHSAQTTFGRYVRANEKIINWAQRGTDFVKNRMNRGEDGTIPYSDALAENTPPKLPEVKPYDKPEDGTIPYSDALAENTPPKLPEVKPYDKPYDKPYGNKPYQNTQNREAQSIPPTKPAGTDQQLSDFVLLVPNRNINQQQPTQTGQVRQTEQPISSMPKQPQSPQGIEQGAGFGDGYGISTPNRQPAQREHKTMQSAKSTEHTQQAGLTATPQGSSIPNQQKQNQQQSVFQQPQKTQTPQQQRPQIQKTQPPTQQKPQNKTNSDHKAFESKPPV